MQPRGNALLVGVGGSGRKSLSRLATYVADQKCFSIEISKGYRITEFREDLKTLYRQVLAIPCFPCCILSLVQVPGTLHC